MRLVSFWGMQIINGLTLSSPPLSTQFGHSQIGQQQVLSTSSQSPLSQWPFQSGASSSSQGQPQWPSPSAFPSSSGQSRQSSVGPTRQSSSFTRPQPGNPAALRPLFQSTATSGSNGIQRIGRASCWAEFGRKADFVGGILLVFVLDLLLLSFTL